MHIAYIRGQEQKRRRKPTYEKQVEALAEHLILKWTVRDCRKADGEFAKLIPKLNHI
jgi:hypothetical protein